MIVLVFLEESNMLNFAETLICPHYPWKYRSKLLLHLLLLLSFQILWTTLFTYCFTLGWWNLCKQNLLQMILNHVRNHHGDHGHPLQSSTTPERAKGRLKSWQLQRQDTANLINKSYFNWYLVRIHNGGHGHPLLLFTTPERAKGRKRHESPFCSFRICIWQRTITMNSVMVPNRTVYHFELLLFWYFSCILSLSRL